MDLNSTNQSNAFSDLVSPLGRLRKQISLASQGGTHSTLAEIAENNQGERRGSVGSEDKESAKSVNHFDEIAIQNARK